MGTMIRHASFSALFALAACAAAETPPAPAPRGQIGIDPLVADADGYVAQRYRRDELPAALIADLTAAGFTCQHSATISQCGSTEHAFGQCFDTVTVRITAAHVEAQKDRRCLGANPPPTP